MATVSGKSIHSVNFQQTAPATVIGTPTISVAETPSYPYANGTAANQTDLLHSKVYTLVASTPQTIDLTSLTDIYGNAVNFARVRSITLVNKSTTAGQTVTVGAAATNAWVGPLGTTTSTLVVPAGGSAFLEDPISAGGSQGWFTSGTSKSLKLDPGSNSQSFEVILAGTSVA